MPSMEVLHGGKRLLNTLIDCITYFVTNLFFYLRSKFTKKCNYLVFEISFSYL